MALEVIGTGFGRTGTDSMREALNILGFGPCHQMFEVSDNDVQRTRWLALLEHGAPDWTSLFDGYRSCVDWPSAHYWRELIDVYPHAKVILTWRDPDSWWTSMSNTLLTYLRTAEDRGTVGIHILERVFGDRYDDRDHVVGIYLANINAVLATVPTERLLVHKLGDGWVPLCAHLGVEVPDRPYPLRNTTADLMGRADQPGSAD